MASEKHQPHHCLFNRLLRRRSRKTSKLRVTGLCTGNSPVTGEFPAQMASNAENISIWWRHHVCQQGDDLAHIWPKISTEVTISAKWIFHNTHQCIRWKLYFNVISGTRSPYFIRHKNIDIMLQPNMLHHVIELGAFQRQCVKMKKIICNDDIATSSKNISLLKSWFHKSCRIFNSSRPIDACIRQYPRPSLGRIRIVACLVPNHHRNQCWFVVYWTIAKKFRKEFDWTWSISIQANSFEYAIWKMATNLLSRAKAQNQRFIVGIWAPYQAGEYH